MKDVYPKHKLSKAETLFYLLKGSVSVFIVSIVASALVTVVSLLVPEIINLTVDSVLGNEPVSDSYDGPGGLGNPYRLRQARESPRNNCA